MNERTHNIYLINNHVIAKHKEEEPREEAEDLLRQDTK